MKSAMFSVCHDDLAEETTAVIVTLGSLVRGPAIAVHLDTPIAEVRRLLVQRRVPAIAVVDSSGQLCGLVTRTDVLRISSEDATAWDAMSGFVFALPTEASVEKAAALMAHEGVGQIVVVRNGNELAGMVSAVDIARYFAVEAGYLTD